MKILLACDGSDCSDRAAKYVLSTLRDQVKSLAVTLFYVDVPMLDRVSAALGEETVARIHRENSEENLRRARTRFKRAGVRCQIAYSVGNAAQQISLHAERGKYDLVVMGSHGRTALKNLLLGSVATQVLSACKVPVLVVR